jgi:hypothetical protein
VLKIVIFEKDRDYEEVCAWWIDYKWEPVPLDHLAKIGLLAINEEKKIAAAWLYQTETAFAWFEFLITNPNIEWKEKKPAIEKLMTEALRLAARCGHKTVFTSLNHPGLIKLYQKLGFKIGDTNVTQLMMRL